MAILLHSGGLDSTTLLWDMVKNKDRYLGVGEPLQVLHFAWLGVSAGKYQAEACEHIWKRLQPIAKRNGVELLLELVQPPIGQARNSKSRPTSEDVEDEWDDILVPGMFLYHYTVALMYAAQHHHRRIFLALLDEGTPALAGKKYETGEVDCGIVFLSMFEQLVHPSTTGLNVEIEYIAPFYHMSKNQIAVLAKKLEVPYELTSSCSYGRFCGVCGQCVSVKDSLQAAKMEIPKSWTP